MYKNLMTLEQVNYTHNVVELKNALRWYIRHCAELEKALYEASGTCEPAQHPG